MTRHTIGMLIFGIATLILTPVTYAQKIDTKRLQELISKFPTPAKKDGKLVDVDKKATDAAVNEMLKDTKRSVIGLVKMLSSKDSQIQVQHALHALVIRVGDKKYQSERTATADALASTLNAKQPAEIRKFVVRQLQLVGTAKETAALGKLLLDADLAEPAAQALLAIKTNAAVQFRNALPKVAAKHRALIVHGLGTLKDKKSAGLLRKILGDKDRDTRLTAAWALANIPDADSAKQILKLAAAAEGYERANATDSCFRLAEHLLAAGEKAAAREIYTHLQKTRTEKSDRYVREAAAKALKSIK